jgi:hypothetical protein
MHFLATAPPASLRSFVGLELHLGLQEGRDAKEGVHIAIITLSRASRWLFDTIILTASRREDAELFAAVCCCALVIVIGGRDQLLRLQSLGRQGRNNRSSSHYMPTLHSLRSRLDVAIAAIVSISLQKQS